MKLLIVDDKEENLYMLATLLRGTGYEVVSAKNGVEALEKLKKDSIEMIISDILMPKMDGFQLCRACKSDDTLRKIPFVFYTATYTNKKDEEFALSLGAEKFIIKPVEPDVFLRIMEGVIEEHRKGALAAQKKPIEKEEVYLAEYNKRLIQKLEKKMLDLERELTEHKRTEDQLKASLKEKEVLLQEIHHRVKNNLQVVSSLLNMQARAAKDKDVNAILSESRNRINAMALIHTQLYEGGDLSAINMKGFMDKLLVQLLQVHSVLETKISPVVHAVDCSLPISIAVPVGLIANEFLSNAFKHAFVNREEGKVEVSLGASEKGNICLAVSDDGVGLPEGFDINASKTLGLRVVKILAEDQLDGNIEVVSDNGTTFKVVFEMAEG